MTSHVALLRGVNVGKAKRVAMADLKREVEALGYANVRTLLNSGNVVFDVPPRSRAAPGPRIEAMLAERLGVQCKVTAISAAELAAAVASEPFGGRATDPSRLLVVVIADPADHAHAEALAAEDWSPEAIAIGPRVAYLWCANGVIDSRVAKALGKRVKDGMTARNWSTMCKLAAMAAG